ncbi:AMP-binding protein [Bacillus sp. EB600]|uniref:AMP-binding protein n=1 Tax=Bacillus sp. EB600 TaxID=2806345 RepID=UPI00210EA2C4|nr:AMP-binding protein [Bacillus sp. EB600]MCQ6281660.1 AMP-binding protein [Bacillus sp. EB600]
MKNEVFRTTRLTESYWPADTSRPLLDWTLGQALREAAAEVPDRIALVEGIPDAKKRRRWTYAQLLADAEQTASALLTKFKPGERIAVWAPNVVEWVLVEFGCAIAGMTMVTVNPAYKASELEYVLKQSRAAGLFLIDEYRGHDMMATANQVRTNTSGLREVIGFSSLSDFIKSGTTKHFPEVKPTDHCIIMYTSGTTGFAKGVLFHHKGTVNACYFTAEGAGLDIGGVWVNPMPMFHIGGCGLATVGVILQRGTQVLVPSFEPGLVLELIEKERGTFSLLVPTMIEALLSHPDRMKYNLSTLKHFMSGASKVEASLVRRVAAELGIGVSIVFGQTEMHGVVSQTHREDSVKDQSETLGQPMPHCEIKVADPETGDVPPIGGLGEFCYRSTYQTMDGYDNMPEETVKVLTPDGWFHSGDIGSMDERGYLRITGRLNDMIIRGGENIYPAEIENLLKSHPKVADATVVGVPDEYWGEQVAAVIVPQSEDNRPTPDELSEYCKANLAGYKRPRRWYFIHEFPITATGKLQKYKLKEMILQDELEKEILL